jgi:hypothetical protein
MFAAAYVIVFALRQAGVNWGLIFSLSGYGAAIGFLLVSAYLYAIFRDNGQDPRQTVEHPLSNTRQYMALYSLMPFLGSLAGLYCTIDADTVRYALLAIAMGTLMTTFFFWIIADPAISFAEMTLPQSRKHRHERHAIVRAEREQKQRNREKMLAEVIEQEKNHEQRLQRLLGLEAQRLATLALEAIEGSNSAESAAVEIGLKAWQYGGLSCMRRLHEMAAEICHARGGSSIGADYISTWWDGIGQWRDKLLT